MFGYVKPYTPELKMREYELYRAIYCGLCRSMGSTTGQLSRFTLNYDFVFLTSIRLLASEAVPEVSKKTCIAHPVKKRMYIHDCEELRYSAVVSAFLMGGKLDDDIADEKGFKKLRALAAHPAVAHMIKKAKKHATDDETQVNESIPAHLSVLAELEKEDCTSLDSCAEAFGTLTGEIFAAGLDERTSRIAREIGRGVGRFIYVCDACDDLCDDYKKGRFNAVLALYGDDAVEKRDGEVYLSASAAEGLLTATLLDLGRCAGAVELLCDDGDREVAALVKNIIYLGMPEILKNILKKRTSK